MLQKSSRFRLAVHHAAAPESKSNKNNIVSSLNSRAICVVAKFDIGIHNHNFLCNNFIIERSRMSDLRRTKHTCD